MEKIRNFRDLDVWKLGKEIVLDRLSSHTGFPKRRNVRVGFSNVADGFNKKHNTESRQFLYVALGSCAELETHVEIVEDLAFLREAVRDSLLEKLDHESKMIRNLIARL